MLVLLAYKMRKSVFSLPMGNISTAVELYPCPGAAGRKHYLDWPESSCANSLLAIFTQRSISELTVADAAF